MRIMSKPVESKLAEYLESVGLRFHPFDQLEASADPRLSSYIIRHETADKAWNSKDCLIAGESGSGRTAIAEELLYNCRMGTDNTEIFPICLREAELTSADSIKDQAVRAAAVEALLEVAYQPEKFEDLGDKDRADLVGAIESAAPGTLNQFLPQILGTGSHLPVVRFADPPAETLPNYPNPDRVRRMAKKMWELNRTKNLSGESSILDIVPAILGLPEIKLIADFQETPNQEKLAELDHLHNDLSNKGKVSKVILVPAGPESGNRDEELINWSPDQLTDVLRARMKRASEGHFYSLDAFSDPGMINIEDEIIEEVSRRGHYTPRAALSLAKTLLELQSQSGNMSQISADTFQKAVEKEFPATV